MRVTEGRLIDLGQRAVARARGQVAESGEAVSTGVAVAKASEDPNAWAQGARAALRHEISQGRGRGVAAARERLAETEGALEGIGDALSDVRELTVQMANGTLGPDERAAGAVEVRALRAHILALANQQGADGEYVLGGARGGSAPFTAGGVYTGDGTVRNVPSSEGGQLAGSLPGTVLGASEGVDVFATLDTLATALEANDVAAVQASLDSLHTAVGQVARARSTLGSRVKALESADVARSSFEAQLAQTQYEAVGAEPTEAIAKLTSAANGLETARALAEKLVALSLRR